MLVCQNCGAIIKGGNEKCLSCGVVVSEHATTSVPLMATAGMPMSVTVRPDPVVLERAVTWQSVAAVLDKTNNNGYSNGNGHGYNDTSYGSTAEPTEIDLSGASAVDTFSAAAAASGSSFFETEEPPAPPPPPELELSAPPSAPALPPTTDLGPAPVAPDFYAPTASSSTPALPATASGAAAADFFNKPVERTEEEVAVRDEFETAKGVDFFASKQPSQPDLSVAGQPPSASTSTDAPPPPPLDADKPKANFDPPVTEPQKIMARQVTPPSGPDSHDFFASTGFGDPVKRPEAAVAKELPTERKEAKESKEDRAAKESQTSAPETESKSSSAPTRRIESEDDDDEPPKIAAPRGYKGRDENKTSSTKKKVVVVADDDDDDDDDEEEKAAVKPKKKPADPAVPPRRSFTDMKKLKETESEAKTDDAGPTKKFAMLEEQVTVLGMSMTRMNLVFIVAIMGFIAIVVFQTFATIVSNFSSTPAGANMAGGNTSLNGGWNFVADWQGRATRGNMNVEQSGAQITGRGVDDTSRGVREWTFNGQIDNSGKVAFTKNYISADAVTRKQVNDKPINFIGNLQMGQDGLPLMTGQWQTTVAVGHFLHRESKTFGGTWFARKTNAPAPPPPGFFAGLMKSLRFWDSWKPTDKFTAVAGIFIAIITTVVGASFSLFGPAGKMNIWEKEKYIPSQFKSEHLKMVKQLVKPLKTGGLPLGRRYEWAAWKIWEWGKKDLAIGPELRNSDPHMLILGAGDKGKSRLMAHMIATDIEGGDRAVVVIDSDGGLTELIAKWVSAHPRCKELAKRVTLLDPNHKGGALGYNPLEMPEDGDLQSAASSIVYGFKAIYTEPPGSQSQWNAQTANILRNCALLLMANGKTLTDIPTLLNDNDFRDVMLESIEKRKNERAEYITLLDTWGQYKRLARTDQWITWVEPILNRVTPMLGDARIRNILTKPVGDIKLRNLILEKKILLVKVAKGQLDQNANLMGSLLVTGVKQAALSLANETNCTQSPVALYLDEFDNFIEKDTIETITSETDKFKIGFVGAIKTLQHLPEDFRNQLIINVGTMACFALAKKDGDLLGPQMFRVDGRKMKHRTITNFFNPVNTSPQFELITDEEKLNIDRVVGQELRTFFAYRVGSRAGVFHMRAHDFNDPPEKDVKPKMIERMYGLKLPEKKETAAKKEKAEKKPASDEE